MAQTAEPSLKQKTTKGIFWGGISNGVQQLLSAGFGIALARILTQADYGLVGMLGIFSGIAITIVNCGFSVALTNKQKVEHKDYNAVFWFTVFVGVFLYGVLFFCAPFIGRFFNQPELIPLSRFLFLIFLISGASTASYTVMFKAMMTKQQAIIDSLSMLIALSIGIVLAINGFAYWALATQMVVQYCLTAILRLIVAPWKPTFHIDFTPLKSLLSFSFKLFLTNIFIQINSYIFSIVFGKLYNATIVGIYSQGQKWMIMGQQFIGGTINYITQPVLVQVNEDKNRQSNIFRKLTRFGAFVSFPLMLGLAFIGKEFILITIGEKWLSSVPFLQLSCIWGSVMFLSALYINLIYSHGKFDWYLYGTMVIGFLQLATVLCLYPWGIFAMVIGYTVTCFIGLAIWQHYASKIICLRLRDVLKDTLPYLTVTLVCFSITWLLTKNIVNLYVLITAKTGISIVLYVVILRYSRSIIYKESLSFLLERFRFIKNKGMSSIN
ncbi:MAG: lipopolysaccharide biosynthesis protein [Dysgonamonadaceae bacterium]|jgi:O-antigen/teichoic acid export membrane protein|nr:lipopolysaccharide biosynthesis protein [Dysgonamonadaceae bacterium]